MRRRYLLMALLAAVAALLVTQHLQQRPAVVAQPLPETLGAHIAMWPRQLPETRPFPIDIEGEVVATHAVTLRAPVDGVVQRIRTRVEETVGEGEELAVIQSPQLVQKILESDSKVEELSATARLYSPHSSPELRKLQAAFEGGKQKYRYAETSFHKVQELFERGLISGNEHADVQVQLEADRLALAAAEQELADARSLSSAHYLKIENQLQVALIEQAQLRKTLGELTIQAPFAGQLRRYAPAKDRDADAWAVGHAIKTGEPLFFIQSGERLIQFDASAAMLDFFTSGDSVTVVSHGGDAQTFTGVVQDITRAPHETGASTFGDALIRIRVAVSNPAFSRLEHRKVTVSKAVPQQGIALPSALVVSEGGERFVYVRPCVAEGESYVRRRVVLSAEQDETVLITGGLLGEDCVAHISGTAQWNR